MVLKAIKIKKSSFGCGLPRPLDGPGQTCSFEYAVKPRDLKPSQNIAMLLVCIHSHRPSPEEYPAL